MVELAVAAAAQLDFIQEVDLHLMLVNLEEVVSLDHGHNVKVVMVVLIPAEEEAVGLII
jgi:hypothetical protein